MDRTVFTLLTQTPDFLPILNQIVGCIRHVIDVICLNLSSLLCCLVTKKRPPAVAPRRSRSTFYPKSSLFDGATSSISASSSAEAAERGKLGYTLYPEKVLLQLLSITTLNLNRLYRYFTHKVSSACYINYTVLLFFVDRSGVNDHPLQSADASQL